MKGILITGGCGFVGRNLVQRLLGNSQRPLLLVDDLSTGIHPDHWLKWPLVRKVGALSVYGEREQVLFLKEDLRTVLRHLKTHPDYLNRNYEINWEGFTRAYHLAAVVGGRAVIENSPLMAAQNLAIDADFFHWVSLGSVEKVLYPSSSAAYPNNLQDALEVAPLQESTIDFTQLGQPDLIYGWAKLSGEYLAQITAKQHGISIACVRPFSGYGENQALSYPIPAIVQRFVNRENPMIVWGDGMQKRDFVHIDDILDAFELAIEKITDGSAVNICSGIASSFRDVIMLLQEISGHFPELAPQTEKPTGVRSRYGDPHLALATLGWQAKIRLKAGLESVYHHLIKA